MSARYRITKMGDLFMPEELVPDFSLTGRPGWDLLEGFSGGETTLEAAQAVIAQVMALDNRAPGPVWYIAEAGE